MTRVKIFAPDLDHSIMDVLKIPQAASITWYTLFSSGGSSQDDSKNFDTFNIF